MSVEASNSMSEVWARLTGQVVNGVFPLHRFLGSSDHSGVFLTESAKRTPSEVAIKLVPIIPSLAESQIARWRAAAELAHPHLLRMYGGGRCQLGGLHYLYVVMEYADQTLAQLLEHRALTDDETREFLGPTLSALAFLHEKGFAQGQLKPSNVLVVGDQLKLSGDTIRPATEAGDGDIWALGVTVCEALTRRQPAGLRGGGGAVALPPDLSPKFREMVAMCLSRKTSERPNVAELEAWLRGEHSISAPEMGSESARREAPAPVAVQPVAPVRAASETTAAASPTSTGWASEIGAAAASARSAETIAPPSVPPARPASETSTPAAATAMRPAPEARTSTGTTAARAATETPAPATATPSRSSSQTMATSTRPVAVPEVTASSTAKRKQPAPAPASEPAQQPATRAEANSGTAAHPPSKRRTLPLIIGAVVVVALGWAGLRALRTDSAPAPLPPVAEDPVQPPSEPAPAARNEAPPAPVAAPASESDGSSSGIQEVIPDVPRGARRTIRGHVRVSIRVIVDKEGTVFAALTERAGPSRYFEKIAIDAAKKWTFPATDTDAERLMLVRFDFTRDGTTARAVPLK